MSHRTPTLIIASLSLALLTSVPPAKAGIITANWAADGDGAVVCDADTYSTTHSAPGVYESFLTMSGIQCQAPGHMVGTITTDTPYDPVLRLGSTVDNDTGVPWMGYIVNVSMNNSFTLSDVILYAPASWAVASPVQPTSDGQGLWTGSMLFQSPSSADAIPNGGTIDFSYKMTFAGLTSYSFTQEMIPLMEGMIPVPEPGLMAGIGGAALLLISLASRSRRARA